MGKYLFVAPFENDMVVMPKNGEQSLDLTYKTGKQVTRPQRNAIYKDGKFTGWGPEYMETIDEVKGGMLLVTPTYQGQDTVALVLVHTSLEKCGLLDADPDWVYLSEIVESKLPSPNNMKPEKITKAKAKQIKVKLDRKSVV